MVSIRTNSTAHKECYELSSLDRVGLHGGLLLPVEHTRHYVLQEEELAGSDFLVVLRFAFSLRSD
jgi:hypothetical protein